MSEPRTEAGRRFLAQWFPEDDRDHDQYDITRRDILAIEREAAGSAGADPEPLDELVQDIAGGIDGEPYLDRAGHDRAHVALKELTARAQGGPSLDVERLARALLNVYDDPVWENIDPWSVEFAHMIATAYARLAPADPVEDER